MISPPALRRTAVGAAGLLLLLLASGMNRPWADRHMLPDILVSSGRLMTVMQVERLLLALAGVGLLLSGIRRKTGSGGTIVQWMAVGLAVLLAIPASEGLMRLMRGQAVPSWSRTDEPLRQPDPVTGWTNIPARRGVDAEYPDRPVYFLDRHGYRVAAEGRTVDTAAPSILFVGESIMFGKGLNWPDSMAARVEATSGAQSANLAVSAYSLSQDYLLLQRELPRFRRPLAVVVLFGPDLMVRDLDRGRPWIDGAVRWHAGTWSWHLGHLGRVLFPYHRSAAVAEAVATDRRILMRIVTMARARSARTLVVVPVFQPERRRERALRHAIFDGAGIPHAVVPLDPRWRLFPDFHPDARAHAAMARAIRSQLP